MNKFNVGIIGLGTIGRDFLTAMQNHDRFTVSAAWDPSATSCSLAQADHPGLMIADNAEQVFDNPTIDVIYIATPPQFHCQYIRSAVAVGKAIYCEKPLGVDLDESRQVVQKVNDSGLVNVINFNHGNALGSCFIEDRIQSGEAGTIFSADVSIHLSQWPREFQKSALWLAGRQEGGFTREMLSHWFYLTRRLLGEGEIIYKNVSYPTDGISSETRVIADLKFGGVPFTIRTACGGVGPTGTTYTLWGEKMSFRLSPGGKLHTATDKEWLPELTDVNNIGEVDQRRTLDGVVARLSGDPSNMPSLADGFVVQQLIEELLR